MSRAIAISCWNSAFVLALIAEHLSTWAEEWILWSTAEFNFLKLPQEFCTGSSIMPQKINPDVLELIRGKTARVIGNLQALLVLVKGLPLAYNRDLQEDKERMFDSFDTVEACLELAAPLVAGATLNRDGDRRAARSRAPRRDDADGVSDPPRACRSGRRITWSGSSSAMALERGCRLADLPLDEFRSADPSLDEAVYGVLGVEKAVAAFRSYGSTAPAEVQQADRAVESRRSGGSKRQSPTQHLRQSTMTMINSFSRTANVWLAAATLLAAIAGSAWSPEDPFAVPAPKAGERAGEEARCDPFGGSGAGGAGSRRQAARRKPRTQRRSSRCRELQRLRDSNPTTPSSCCRRRKPRCNLAGPTKRSSIWRSCWRAKPADDVLAPLTGRFGDLLFQLRRAQGRAAGREASRRI